MAESYRELAAGFSTADAEHLEVDYRDGDLKLRFVDWRDKSVSIRFPSAVAFRWQVAANLPSDIRDDESYEVLNSHWLAELSQLGATEAQHRHYKLCFNAEGILDVISDVLEVTD
jgi:hypothetical protein